MKKVSEFVQAVSEEEIETEIDANLRISKLVRFKKINWNNYYHYMGGFTTPSCYEVANWILMREPLKVSESFVSILLCKYLLIKWLHQLCKKIAKETNLLSGFLQDLLLLKISPFYWNFARLSHSPNSSQAGLR